MKKGFDAASDCTKYASCLVADGYQFVCRYYNINDHSKNLSLAEAHVLSSAGLSIVAVWENGFPTNVGYFSFAVGVHDGTAAYNYAMQQIGQPAGTPIYFAVDYDPSQADMAGAVLDYFRGIQAGFIAISKNNPQYAIGVYGSGLACSSLLKNNAVTFTWLAQPMEWRGSAEFKDYNILQKEQITLCKALSGGVTGDPDTSPNDQEGSFTVLLQKGI